MNLQNHDKNATNPGGKKTMSFAAKEKKKNLQNHKNNPQSLKKSYELFSQGKKKNLQNHNKNLPHPEKKTMSFCSQGKIKELTKSQ